MRKREKMKKIMILGASILQLPAIEKALAMGLQLVVVDMNPEAVGMKMPGIIPEVVSTIDVPAVVAVAKKRNIDGVMTLASDMPMRSVAAVAKELNLVGITDDTALKATNKAVMRQALKNAGVPVPNFFKVSNKDEYDKAVSNFAMPFIVKPADNSGSRGIFEIADLTCEKLIDDAYNYSKQYSRNGDVVVEEYMNGPEVSVETLTVDGECHVIQITDKITTGAPHFVEMGHTQPTRLPGDIPAKIAEVAKAANKAIGITNGPSHTEIIVTSEGPKIVELGARLGGDCIATHLVPLSTGVDMVECCIKIALGEKPDIEAKFSKGSAIRYFKQHAGIVKAINGIEDVKKIKGVHQISIVHGIGETVTEIDSSTARMGFIIAQGENADAAASICKKAKDSLNIVISPN